MRPLVLEMADLLIERAFINHKYPMFSFYRPLKFPSIQILGAVLHKTVYFIQSTLHLLQWIFDKIDNFVPCLLKKKVY